MIQVEDLYTLRKKLGLSQERLAELLGVSRNTVSRWEQGSYKPSAENITALNKLFAQFEEPVPPTEPAVAVVPEPAAPAKPKRWPMAVLCIGVVCALLIGIISLMGIHSINQKLDPVDTAVPMEEMPREEVDISSMLEPIIRQPLQP